MFPLFSHRLFLDNFRITLLSSHCWNCLGKGHKLALFHKICWPLFSTFAVSQGHLTQRCSFLRTVLCTLPHPLLSPRLLLSFFCRFLHFLSLPCGCSQEFSLGRPSLTLSWFIASSFMTSLSSPGILITLIASFLQRVSPLHTRPTCVISTHLHLECKQNLQVWHAPGSKPNTSSLPLPNWLLFLCSLY